MMLERWQQLNSREKVIVGLGAVIIVALFFYSFVWSPVLDKSKQLLEKIQQQSVELSWMQHAGLRIKRLQSQGFVNPRLEEGPALVLVEQSLMKVSLSNYIKKIQQPEAHKINLELSQVPFDAFIDWVQSLGKATGIHVVQTKVVRTDIDGVVNVTVLLQQ